MARIAGVDLNRSKRIEAALPYIYGIGPTGARAILATANVDPDTRVKDLTDAEVARLRQVIEEGYKVEGALRAEVAANVKRLIAINSYRGMRHKKGMPCHGQRTKTNARTRKGPRKTVGRKRKKK
ncbi:MAG: 30S ribosomal protein S13 [candidate division Zixibacteria bacterium]|nr:30S ribosomal protein S13 [candidate division Zixibacteria bacterium]